ncbi:thiamine pyrophosphate-dependent dehydrogenase E1 component subunit alpha [Pseudonocardia sp. N23]|uniref:thiamine pyrophosphate-dependent dehydrogenase E1 component subunit alpha n=1 Tax=Pseudonocardia sp. N23 TaxID=1987376 RepID=UPI000BFC4D3E|nr:thiamine pyrophosphate-dependent dehydrogenase E1 component subunit alpha [Pseudonocardia sp. N23]GAY09747.1 acetoin dehydrogenase E1 component alpha-subunit [Pseudonocardia sp. N23]
MATPDTDVRGHVTVTDVDLYTRMLLIRRAEERLIVACADGSLPGGVHLYIGEEAVAVGACAVMTDRDYVTSTHRGHGHFLAKGGDIDAMFAEIWGKATGICKGMGGSMHVADVSKGILGANGIVGAGFAIATGAAWGAKLAGEGRVATCFFGDGAANQGSFSESMNVSAAWELPTIFVCENNGVSEFTVTSTVTGGTLVDRARAFMPATVVDGNDVHAVRDAVGAAVERARAGGGPSYVEATTFRIRGHLEAEQHMLGGGTYRSEDDVTAWQADDKDPLPRLAARLLADGTCERAALDRIDAEVRARVEAAVAYAEASPPADPDLAPQIMFGPTA